MLTKPVWMAPLRQATKSKSFEKHTKGNMVDGIGAKNN